MLQMRNIKKAKSNKRGVVLAYVIAISAALLILSAALFSMSSYNLAMSKKAAGDRQAYLTAKSAVEYAKNEITRLASEDTLDTNSIRNGVSKKTFYVINNGVNGVNDLSISNANEKPSEEEFAAQCDLKLVKTQHFAEVKFRVWIDKKEVKSFNFTNTKPPVVWEGKDNAQTIPLLKPDDDPLASPLYKPFPFEEIVAIKGWDLSYRMSIDRYTVYTYDATVQSKIFYNNSKHSEQLTFKCSVKPGSAVLHEVKAAKPPASQFVVAGAQYGDNVLMDGLAYPLISPAPSTDNAEVSEFPVVFPVGFRLGDFNQTFSAPSIFIMNTLTGNIAASDKNVYTFKTDFLYIDDTIDGLKHKGKSTAKLEKLSADAAFPVICLKNDYYLVKNADMNLFNIKEKKDLSPLSLTDIKTTRQIPRALLADVKKNYQKMITGDAIVANRGTNWTINGKFDGINTMPLIPFLSSHVNWYIKDSANWTNSLNPISNTYQAEKINLQGNNLTLKVPPKKPIVFQADFISMAGISKITVPNINTDFSSLKLKSNSGNLTVSTPQTITVSGKQINSKGETISFVYQIKPGTYIFEKGEIDLFSEEAKDAFLQSLGGNGTGGGESAPDEEPPGITKANPRKMELTEGRYEK